MRIYLDGQPIDIETIELTSAGQDNVVVPPPISTPRPPVEDTPPPRPVIPPERELTENWLGALTGNVGLRSSILERNRVFSIGFYIPREVEVPLATFAFVPQGDRAGTFETWLSESAAGPVIKDSFQVRNARRGSQFSIAVAPDSSAVFRRGPRIEHDKTYYVNILYNGTDLIHPVSWRVTGAFPRF